MLSKVVITTFTFSILDSIIFYSILSLLEEDGRIYRAVLGKSMFPLKDTTDEIIQGINNSSPSKAQKTVLPYSTPTKRRSNAIDSPFRNSYSSSPLPFEAQMILTSPRKPLRYISKHPYKVLDAPDLQVYCRIMW